MPNATVPLSWKFRKEGKFYFTGHITDYRGCHIQRGQCKSERTMVMNKRTGIA